MLQIRNLRNKTEFIHRAMYANILTHPAGESFEMPVALSQQIKKLRKDVDVLSEKHQATPADLGTSSFRIYLWLRFMSEDHNLQLHVQGLKEFTQLLRVTKKKEMSDGSASMLKIDYSGYLYHRKTTRKKTTLMIHEGFINAPMDIKKAVITSAFAKRRGNAATEVKAYAASQTYQKLVRQVSGLPIANREACVGDHVNLADLFASINRAYFSNALPQPRLVWSSARAKRRLGYYHPEIHTIALNKKLDSQGTPELLLRYILYHEMLHQNFGIEHRNGRRYAHTRAFHAAEKLFHGYQEAENLIKLL